MAEERDAARVVALCDADRREDARSAAARFLRERPASPLAAWATALLFATHPLHDEAVTYLAARGHVMCLALSLLSVCLYAAARAGDHGPRARAGLIVASLVALFAAVMIVSPTVRARVRVLVMKSFFQYKYDYRKEWLRFISTLSTTEADNVPVTAIRSSVIPRPSWPTCRTAC